jgi:hypothetical protein
LCRYSYPTNIFDTLTIRNEPVAIKKNLPILAPTLNSWVLLQYFRLNDPYRIIGLLVLLLIFFLPLLVDTPGLTLPELKGKIIGEKIVDGFQMYSEVIDHTAPLTGWLYATQYFLFGESLLARHIICFLSIFLLATLWAIILIDKRAYPESSYIPPLIFGILSLFSFDTLSLSGILPATFFLLLSLNSLFREIESREQSPEMVLKTGLFIGIASMFQFSFIIYVAATLIILILYTRTSGRKILLMIAGFAIPHFLLVGIYHLNDSAAALWQYFYVPNFSFSKDNYIDGSSILYSLAIPLLFFLASLVLLNRESRFTKYQSQLLQVMFFWTMFSIAQAYYSQEFTPQSFFPLMIGLSFFIGHFFTIVSRRRFSELTFLLFTAGIIGLMYLGRYDVVRLTGYKAMFPARTNTIDKGKKMLVLKNDISLYNGNKAVTPFLNWELSEDIFRQPQYYENVRMVYDGIRNDAPDVIIDPENLLFPFIQRIPELRRSYTRTPDGYRRREINASN